MTSQRASLPSLPGSCLCQVWGGSRAFDRYLSIGIISINWCPSPPRFSDTKMCLRGAVAFLWSALVEWSPVEKGLCIFLSMLLQYFVACVRDVFKHVFMFSFKNISASMAL